MRVKTEETVGEGEDGAGIIGRGPPTGDNPGTKVIYMSEEAIAWETGFIGGFITDAVINDGEWHQIVVTFEAIELPPEGGEGGTGDFRMYVDGEVVINEEHPANAFDEHSELEGLRADETFRIGQAAESLLFEAFPGLIDDVAIWSVALPEEDVAALADGAAILSPPSPFIITEIEFDPAAREVSLTWNSLPAQLYAVESTPDLNIWEELNDGLESQGASTSVTLKAPDGTTQLNYRIREVE